MDLYPAVASADAQGMGGGSRAPRPPPPRMPAITRPLSSWLSDRLALALPLAAAHLQGWAAAPGRSLRFRRRSYRQ